MKTINVLLIENSSVYRTLIKQKLNGSKNINVVGECGEGVLVLDFLDRQSVDVVLMDDPVGRMDGIETVKHLKDNYPQAKIVALSSNGGFDYINKIMDAGASSFLDKWEVTFAELQEAIVSVCEESIIEEISH
jgi:two-component system response regulator DegU